MKRYFVERIGGVGVGNGTVCAWSTMCTCDAPRFCHAAKPLTDASGDGFEYGYSGGGPDALACAIARDALGQDAPPAATLAVRERIVARASGSRWWVDADEVLRIMAGATRPYGLTPEEQRALAAQVHADERVRELMRAAQLAVGTLEGIVATGNVRTSTCRSAIDALRAALAGVPGGFAG